MKKNAIAFDYPDAAHFFAALSLLRGEQAKHVLVTKLVDELRDGASFRTALDVAYGAATELG